MVLFRILGWGLLFLMLTIQTSEALTLYPTSVTLTLDAGETGAIPASLTEGLDFSWAGGADQPWISLDPAEGDGQAAYAVNVTVNTSTLTPGVAYIGRVYFVSSLGAMRTLDVTLVVTLPGEESKAGELTVSPTQVDLSVSKYAAPEEVGLTVIDGVNGSTSFTWSVSSSAAWLDVDSGPYTGPGEVIATVDASDLDPGTYEASLTFFSNLSAGAQSTEVPVNITVSTQTQGAVQAQQEQFTTSSWLDLSFDLTGNSGEGKLFVLWEHPQLAPGQVYAYRYDLAGARLDLFSQWGEYTSHAFDYAYAPDAQETSTVGIGGLRLIGMEGDLTVRIVAGPSIDQLVELKRCIVHVLPITGEWEVSDHYYGQWYTYPYPLILSEERGLLSAEWADASCDVIYGNPADTDDQRLEISDTQVSVQGSGDYSNAAYLMYVTRTWAEFFYEVTWLEPLYLEGLWQFRWLGTQAWSVPQRFAAVRTDVDISDVIGTMPGQRGEVEVGLHWSNYNDLDLHVIDPDGEEVYYASPMSSGGGELDVDANAGCSGDRTQDAWEHVVWVQDPPAGEYRVQVNFFAQCDGAPAQSTFQVIVKIGTDERVYTGSVSAVGETVDVTTFEY